MEISPSAILSGIDQLSGGVETARLASVCHLCCNLLETSPNLQRRTQRALKKREGHTYLRLMQSFNDGDIKNLVVRPQN